PELRMDFAVRAVCVACGQGHVLFDSGLHGWDVVCYGHRRASSLPFRPWRCPQCGEAAHRGTVRFTVVPDERSVSRYSAGAVDETRRIDAFTVITIGLVCCACGQAAPAWARFETTGFALTNPYLPLSMELTVLWDGARIGRVAVKKRQRKAPTLIG